MLYEGAVYTDSFRYSIVCEYGKCDSNIAIHQYPFKIIYTHVKMVFSHQLFSFI